jgi:hypothetical protein
MNTYEFTFTGRRKDAIGVPTNHVARRQGNTEDEARIALYNEFEHIHTCSKGVIVEDKGE